MKKQKHKGYGFKSYLHIKDKVNHNLKIKWAKTPSYNHFANNHCAAVLVENISIYYQELNLINFKVDFKDIHNIVGNGPVLFLARKTRRYYQKHHLNLKTKVLFSQSKMKEQLDMKIPIALLLRKSLFDWHWVLAVAYLEIEDDMYFKVANGWVENDMYYKENESSRIVFVNAFELL